MNKKFISWLLVLCMTVTIASVPVFAAYTDTEGHWGEEAINRWSGYGIVNGDDKGNFNPDNNMTRAEAAAVFERLLNISTEGNISLYTDVKSTDWFASSVAKCVGAGIMNGVSANEMNPYGTLTREQMFVMLGRALKIDESNTAKTPATDHNDISDWAEGIINSMLNLGYIKGVGGGNIAPLADINRASVMSLLNQTITTYANTTGTVNAAKGGIVLVVSDGVAVTGEADTVVIAKADSKVTINADVDTVNVVAKGVKLAVEGSIDTINIEADDTSVSGNGKVETANVNADNAKVDTKNTKLNVATGVTGTTANGKPVSTESTGTKDENKKPSSGGGGGGGSSSHRHNYVNGKCSCGDKTAERMLAVSATSATTVYGKSVADIMENVAVVADSEIADKFNVSGTAKYVTGWTAFNSEVEAEQTGHYITLDIARPTAFPANSEANTFIIGEKTLVPDNDGIRLTTRIDDLADGKVTVKLNWSETEIEEYVLDFSNVTLASAE